MYHYFGLPPILTRCEVTQPSFFYCFCSMVIYFHPRKLVGKYLRLMSSQFHASTLCLEMPGRGSLVVFQPKVE